jgi:hypothetical protein
MLLHEGVVVKNSGGHPVGLSVREKAYLHRLTPESSLYDMPTVSIMALFVGKQEVVRAGLSPSDGHLCKSVSRGTHEISGRARESAQSI